MNKKLKNISYKNFKRIISILPLIISIILIAELLSNLFSQEFIANNLSDNTFKNILLIDIIGSLFASNPIISYILGEKMISSEISLIIVTVFILSWVTVGVIQIPLEIETLGKKFAIIRNIFAFLFAMIIPLMTTIIYWVIT